MTLLLVGTSRPVVEAWRHCFAGEPGVEVIHGDICQIQCDAIVSPANSFGFMDGGLDLALSLRFGWDVQKRLQELIRGLPARELLVGQALLLPTGDPVVPWLISAPTMRLPAPIDATVNAYLAMKAILSTLIAAHTDPPIRTCAVPGLGTGVGRLDPRTAAHQMYSAYREIVLGQEFMPQTLLEAALQEQTLIHAADFEDALHPVQERGDEL